MDGIVCSLFSVLVFLLNTNHGIGVLPDSTKYMGLHVLPYDAPGYAWLLQIVAVTGIRIEAGAKLIGLVLVGTNSFLVWHLLAITCKRVSAAIATALIILSPQFVMAHALAMSEPLFIFFILVALHLLLEFWSSYKRAWLVGCGVAIGAAALVRFTAPPFGAAVAASLLLDNRRQLRQRVVDAGTVGALSGGIFFAWVILSEIIEGRATGRDLQFYGNLDIGKGLTSLDAFTALLLPVGVPLTVRLVTFVLLLVAIAYIIYRSDDSVLTEEKEARWPRRRLVTTLGLFLVLYLSFFLLAVQIEANLYLNGRYALPIYVTSVIMVAVVLSEAVAKPGPTGTLGACAHGLCYDFSRRPCGPHFR